MEGRKGKVWPMAFIFQIDPTDTILTGEKNKKLENKSLNSLGHLVCHSRGSLVALCRLKIESLDVLWT